MANPAVLFFDKPILSSQNYETVPLYSHDSRPEALHVEGLLSIKMKGVNLLDEPVTEEILLGSALSVIDVKYIILAKDADWKEYDFLSRQADLKKIYEGTDLVLYQNLSFGQEEI